MILENTTSSKESMINGEDFTYKFTSSMLSLLIEVFFAETVAVESLTVIVESSKEFTLVIFDVILLSVQ